MSDARVFVSPRIDHVDIAQEGIIITFHDQKSAFFDAQYLYDHQDVSGNYPLGEDTFEA